MATPPRKYQQPSRINGVSLTLLLVLCGAGYLAASAWPVISLNANVKDLLEDALPHLYRTNLLPEPESTIGAEQVKHDLVEKLTALGIPDPETALTVTRDASIVALAVKIHAAINLRVAGQRIPVTLTPRAETRAARVSY